MAYFENNPNNIPRSRPQAAAPQAAAPQANVPQAAAPQADVPMRDAARTPDRNVLETPDEARTRSQSCFVHLQHFFMFSLLYLFHLA